MCENVVEVSVRVDVFARGFRSDAFYARHVVRCVSDERKQIEHLFGKDAPFGFNAVGIDRFPNKDGVRF